MTESRCRSCGAAIVWAQSRYGSPMPLDAEPVAGGNVRLGPDGVALVLAGPALEEARAGTLVPTLYLSHFAGCPNASAHRRPYGA